ncbi:MAG: tRNA delta(2)-isopentenylpyrophosphate transferase, tRNA dimethylallyltransferase [Candidatus Parcubacteria bacterium]|jgi:tRNA dimethylallyltransferase
MNHLSKIIVVAGPTSSGKSDFAVDLALKVNGEVISADSRQIYRGLDIGTGKITREEMKGVPHHMLDICDINETFSVAQFRDKALPIIDDILSRGKMPIICGGTGYYIDAIIYENTLPEVPITPSLEEELSSVSTEELFKQLKDKDPRRASEIDSHNRVRIIRALEIIKAIGKVPEKEEPVFRYDVEFYLLNPSKELLEERVHKRLLKRFEAGMIAEMESLIAQGYEISVLASKGIEYKWMAKYLEQKISYEELVKRLRIATWQYAKRQRTWNKKYYSFAKIIEPRN